MQLVLQVLVLLLLLVQLILGSVDSYEMIAGAPTFSLEWRFDDFMRNVWKAPRVFNVWEGKVHFNLNRVAFETNLTSNPSICLDKPEICLGSGPDGSMMRRFVWPLEDFAQAVQDEIDMSASKLFILTGRVNLLLGLATTDAPWSSDLAVTSSGHACGGIDEYAYSWHGSPSGMFDCNRVYDVRMPPTYLPYLRAHLSPLPPYPPISVPTYIRAHLSPPYCTSPSITSASGIDLTSSCTSDPHHTPPHVHGSPTELCMETRVLTDHTTA